MGPDPTIAAADTSRSDRMLRNMLGGMSIFTMLMTIPQIATIWVGQEASGVSVVSWSAYLLSALLWFWHGVIKRDKNIYLACLGWIGLDVAVIVGAVVYG